MSAFWITTATATSGSCAGANETNQAYGGTSGLPLWAVPVLPATWTPGMAPGVAVPLLTVSTISWVTWSAVCADTAWSSSCGWVCRSVSNSGGLDRVDDVRLHHHALVGDAGGDHRHLQWRGP